MKNMKVSVKLIVGFLLVALLTAIVGVVGIYGMRTIDTAFDEMYNMQTVPLPELGKAIEMLQRQRACMREMIIGAAVGDMEMVEEVNSRVDRPGGYRDVMYAAMDAYDDTILSPIAQEIFNDARNLYNTQFREAMVLIYEGARNGEDAEDLYAIMGRYTAATNEIVAKFDECMAMKIDVAADAAATSSANADRLLIVIIAVLAISLGAAVFLAMYISGLISKPLIMLSSFMNKAGTTGDLRLSNADRNNIDKLSKVRDEIGQTIGSAAAFVDHVTVVSKDLATIASGDLTVNVKLLSNDDTMGKSMQQMVDNLNNMFGEIQNATGQVSTGSKQIADGAQALAQGSTEQAASVEQLSASIGEIARKTKDNADMAGRAASLANTIKNNAEKGSQQMGEMTAAVREINQASQSISKVIKVIDDIAFQTNILALNAAVEAARAGQHGKGFAVVAEEVRNLAAKSAEAAKDTGGLIANSMEKAELGSRIAGETAESLAEIVSGINESNQIVSEIATSSNEQTVGITQINTGIDQVAQVIQQNSATAEQSAAASEEMSSQSNMLEEMIAQFKLKNESKSFGYEALPNRPAPAAAPPPAPKYDKPSISDSSSSGDFGKY